MSLKSIIQILILILIISIIGAVYYQYFDTKNNLVEETNLLNNENEFLIKSLERKLFDLELENKKLNEKINKNENKLEEMKLTNSSEIGNNTEKKNKEKLVETKVNVEEKKIKLVNKDKILLKNKKVKNLVKDVEYTSVDQKGNKFYLLANSAKSNSYNNDILDLDNVRGKITSDIRDTIYIISDYAKYNSVNLNSQFYDNVVINYQDKEITCINFDINMETNKAIAYNEVVVTDPKSIMKAGIVEFDLKTKNININPESSLKKIEVVTN